MSSSVALEAETQSPGIGIVIGKKKNGIVTSEITTIIRFIRGQRERSTNISIFLVKQSERQSDQRITIFVLVLLNLLQRL